jgi:hypothetical protein
MFITPFGAYAYTTMSFGLNNAGATYQAYTTMSFGLNNAGATYQQAIQLCLTDQLHRNVEAYVDNVIITIRSHSKFIADLEETFNSLRRFRWKLNLTKCFFSVPQGKLLGFIVSHHGIQANLEKINAITAMDAPKTIKDV